MLFNQALLLRIHTLLLIGLFWLTPLYLAHAESIVSSLSADFDGDGKDDFVTLIKDSDDDDYVHLEIQFSQLGELNQPSQHQLQNETSENAEKNDFIWHGKSAGMEASLNINKRGSLEVLSQNSSIGRNRWSKKMTLAVRDKHFIVAGFLYKTTDTITGKQTSCDVNLLTGKGYINNRLFKFPINKQSLNQWKESIVEKMCQ